DHIDDKIDLGLVDTSYVAHDQLPQSLRLGRSGGRIALECFRIRCQPDCYAQQCAVTGRRIVAPPAHALKDRITVKPLGQETGQPTVAAEERGTRIARAGTTLVAVRVGDDSHPIVLLKSIAHNPFECSPGRVHLDGRFHRIVRILDVGVAPPDMSNHDTILAVQPREQVVGSVRVRSLIDTIDRIGNLSVRRPVDGFSFMTVMHVAVAADGGVCRPLVAGDAHKPAGFVECFAKRVKLVPESSGYLEIVALMPNYIEES